MTFDEYGYITPYQIIEISLPEFEEIFILTREEKGYRNKLFNNYLKYLNDIKNIIGNDFFQLINDSFTTLKLKPDDIDFVTFVEYETLKENEAAINELCEIGKKKYGLDSFFAPYVSGGHPYFRHSQLIFEYWQNLFSFSRMNDKGNHLPKGLIKITFPQ